MVFILKISREAGGVQKLYYWDPTGAYVDTGITIDKFFFSRTDSVGATSTIWRSIKMVVNPTVSPPVYDCIEIDGHHFDLSAFQPQLLNTVGTTLYDHYNMNFFYVGMQTDEAVAKILNVDDVLMSSNE